MRVHILMDDDLVERIDAVAGERGRSGWIVSVIRERLDVEERWRGILAGVGCLADTGHEWDDDPAAWVRAQRREQTRLSDDSVAAAVAASDAAAGADPAAAGGGSEAQEAAS